MRLISNNRWEFDSKEILILNGFNSPATAAAMQIILVLELCKW